MKEVALIGFSQVIFFIIILFLKRDKQLKDYLLISFFFCIGLELLFRFLIYTNSHYYSSRLVLFDIIYWALFGPILLFYIRSIIDKKFKFRITHLFHLLPLIVSLAAVADYILNISSKNSFPNFSETSRGLVKLGLLSWEHSSPIYLLFILVILIKHRKRVRNYFSNTEKRELNWLFVLTIGFTLFVYTSNILWLFTDLFPISESLKLLTVFLGVFVFVLGIYGYRQENIFYENITESNKDQSELKSKYQKSFLDHTEREMINKKLLELMQEEKPYLECEMNINELAKRIGVSTYKLSRIINEDYKCNFFDFINTYRIREVKQFLINNKFSDLKIESIAYDCGFNSKSSFYSIFKKQTNLTPKEFKEKFKIYN